MKYSGAKKRFFTRQFWGTLELKYYTLFLFAVFFSFSTMGFVSDLLSNLRYSYSALFIAMFSSGLVSVGYVYAATKNRWAFPVTLILQLIFILYLRQIETGEVTDEFLYTKSRFVGIGLMISVLFGYVFFVIFITKVGINQFLLKAEMKLAKEIHEVLVPEIKLSYNNIELYGKSIPAEDVGGDLIDVSEQESSLICTISDVSGHGVSSGVYTGMFKSSLRTIIKTDLKLSSVLTKINSSLQPMMKKNMFITTAMIKLNKSNSVEYSIAGHLPILHFKKKENRIEELMIKQLPIGFKEDFEFKSGNVEYEEGDIFLLITDGITETSDKSNSDFGIDLVKEHIIENCALSPEQIADKLFDSVESYGQQRDDVTLMIIKC